MGCVTNRSSREPQGRCNCSTSALFCPRVRLGACLTPASTAALWLWAGFHVPRFYSHDDPSR